MKNRPHQNTNSARSRNSFKTIRIIYVWLYLLALLLLRMPKSPSILLFSILRNKSTTAWQYSVRTKEIGSFTTSRMMSIKFT